MIFDLTVPQFIKMLRNLDGLLDKAAQHADAKKFSTDVLVQSRLAPDQFPLARQIQIACDTAKLCGFRLTGKTAPSNEDTEKTFPELKARIAGTIGYLEGLTSKDYSEASAKQVTQPRWEGKWMKGDDYVVNHAIPNFYFHVTTAYAILRHNGVDVGKNDYLGKLPFNH
ncbi:DUF1993 family protein [Bdellovibrio bacteriovorus]|uniref:DUF1993 domain-containing protein n=1 Tax=Bdellovibrio bacteriovorus TaxID=959 RepID=A0A150WW04_BDEBC|nr:DUF1993 domain-containing protein [Bdellovibrio bacteriovorus]KYG70609.1 hypothetical protein AZI85_01340 [Bdellovibrio bacteriovorus]